MGKKIVMALFGSLGDLHPYLAVAIGLQERGHEVTIATSKMYRREIEGEGIGFHAVRPDLASLFNEPLAIGKALDVETGDRYVMCQGTSTMFGRELRRLSFVRARTFW